MVAQAEIRKRRSRRPLPPGQRLLLLLLLSGICCAVTMWVIQSRSSVAESAADIGGKSSVVQPNPSISGAAASSASVAPFNMGQEMAQLKTELLSQCEKPNLHAGIFIVEPATGKFVDIDGRRAYSAASMIKLPVLIALAEALDAKQVSFDQPLTIRQDLIGGGSGWLQWRKPGTKISLKETAELMMIISDNTATNMIIDVLGGKDKVNSSFARWQLNATRINNPLPDLPGTNTTSPFDLACLLGKIDAGQLISAESRNWVISTLMRNKIKTLLPMGIPPGTTIADKTGDIASLVGDAGIITTKNGQHYIASVAVERPWNDRRANALIRQISKQAYVGITGDADGVKSLNESAPRRSVSHSHGNGHRRHGRRRH